MPTVKSTLMLIWALLECLFFSGLIYGWISLVYVLKREGIYASLCEDAFPNSTGAEETLTYTREFGPIAHVKGSELRLQNGTTGKSNQSAVPSTVPRQGCPAQDQRLTLAFTVAVATTTTLSVVFGHLSYVSGTRVTRLLAAASFSLGMLLLAFISPETPWLIFPASALIGVGGLQIMVTNIQISLLFGKWASTAVGLIQGAFDASSLVFLLLKLAYERGVAVRFSCLLLLGLHAMVVVSTLGWLPRTFIWEPEPGPTPRAGQSRDPSETEPITAQGIQGRSKAVKTKRLFETSFTTENPSLRSCVLSPYFLLHVLWMTILYLCLGFFLASLNVNLNDLLHGDLEQVSHFINAAQYALFAGLVTSPAAGALYDAIRKAFAGRPSPLQRKLMPAVVPLVLTTVLAVAMSLSLLASHPEVLYLTFVLLLLFRSFLFSITSAFLSLLFPMNYFGVLYGLMVITMGLTSLLANPLVAWAQSSGFPQVNVFLTALNFVSLAHPGFLWWRCRARNSRAD